LADLPLTIEPGVGAAVRIQLLVPESNGGQLTRTVYLWTDLPKQPVISFRIACLIE
jgi:hypothetical protein